MDRTLTSCWARWNPEAVRGDTAFIPGRINLLCPTLNLSQRDSYVNKQNAVLQRGAKRFKTNGGYPEADDRAGCLGLASSLPVRWPR